MILTYLIDALLDEDVQLDVAAGGADALVPLIIKSLYNMALPVVVSDIVISHLSQEFSSKKYLLECFSSLRSLLHRNFYRCTTRLTYCRVPFI